MSFAQDPDRGRPPKQVNALLGLFDKPPQRDWLVWWTVGLMVIAGLSIAFPAEETARTTSLPRWADALLATVVFGVLFGFFPAYLRLLVRRVRFRRSAATTQEQQVPDGGGGSVSGSRRYSPSKKVSGGRGPAQQSAPGRSAPAAPQEQQVPPPSSARPADLIERGNALSAEPPGVSPHVEEGRPAVGPVTIGALDLTRVRNSGILSQARHDLPYPIARAARIVQQAPTMKETYEAVLRAAEAISTVLGISATLWARRYGVTTTELRKLQRAFQRNVSWGVWTDAARSVQGPMAGHPHALPGMAEALRSGKVGTPLVSDLQDLAKERNRWAHGRGPRNQLEASQRLEEVYPLFERALSNAGFLGGVTWILVNDSKLQRRERDFQIRAAKGMGDHPDFDVMTFTSPTALAEDTFYLLTPDGPMDMTPLVVFRPCPACHQQEVAYAEGLDDRKGVAFKTFDRGHVVYDSSLVEELRHLVEDEGNGRESDTA
ncbi:hypothetical protein [Blastococcus haudaquaticus]|uniref:Uncharacterized protein n=1 Tax=Blastococcus haudaquaticus TaxID=1938745 RepID=A0A286H6V2_9ACTN|nr:hypothetical protein [Blastococcus haudaquaticus]SOE03497.1 hypothetical protein SAMN06272739_4201 [Blastococcus haudaquaticus]